MTQLYGGMDPSPGRASSVMNSACGMPLGVKALNLVMISPLGPGPLHTPCSGSHPTVTTDPVQSHERQGKASVPGGTDSGQAGMTLRVCNAPPSSSFPQADCRSARRESVFQIDLFFSQGASKGACFSVNQSEKLGKLQLIILLTSPGEVSIIHKLTNSLPYC